MCSIILKSLKEFFNQHRLIVLLIVTFCYSFAAIRANIVYAQPFLLEVTEYAWTNGVSSDRNPINRLADNNIAPVAPLYLWTKMKGGLPELQALQEKNKLPIRHKWFRYVGTRPYFDEAKDPAGEPLDVIDLPIGTQNKWQLMRETVERQGYFEWRVWSGKENIRSGWWRVDLVYADNTPILCQGEPCSFKIRVK